MELIDSTIDKTELRVELVSLLREIAKKPFHLIDQILGLDPGSARQTYEQHTEAYRKWQRKFASDALENFYKDQITILQMLAKSAPAAIKLWSDNLLDEKSKPIDRERAAKEIREWTKLFLASKEKAGVRDLIPKALLEAHDKAEELGGQLNKMLGDALDLDDERGAS